MVDAALRASMRSSESRHLFICTSCTLTEDSASLRTLTESSIAGQRLIEDLDGVVHSVS
ncbi:hypothetical protein CBOM_00972 [Ceraceosorus bombacis]|uniref:Uncharacterized protein n=1 Tax=Ceraceosorus bombacis TaxID=401625 RepID=A0A0P1BBJ5_9BASI|nr:hypothetical protein CBOM_00972 [Ceraceosorus bombacis]